MTECDPACWTVLSESEIFRVGERLTVSQQHVRLPDGREVEGYLRFATQTVVSIFPVTTDGKVICERQYKHGVGHVTLTLPAGAMEAGEVPLQAAQRELLEETGFESGRWTFLGTTITHANAGGSICHLFLAQDCRCVAEPDSGDLEEMVIEHHEVAAIVQALRSGEMKLALDIATATHGLLALDIATATHGLLALGRF